MGSSKDIVNLLGFSQHLAPQVNVLLTPVTLHISSHQFIINLTESTERWAFVNPCGGILIVLTDVGSLI